MILIGQYDCSFMRAIVLGTKNYLFVGSKAGGMAAAIAHTLIETAKLNAVDPNAWLPYTLARIPDDKDHQGR
ncbi:MAG: transposase domain-containing protein [Rhodobacteraceae bacterium]|nr:transposase domain-containing protein [Paracoccaceae bacterium]